MKVIVGGRQTGKTIDLIKRSAECNGYIVCHSLEECSRIFAIARELDLLINFPICYAEFINHHYYSKGIKFFLIDNVNLLLQRMSKVPIDTITVNIND